MLRSTFLCCNSDRCSRHNQVGRVSTLWLFWSPEIPADVSNEARKFRVSKMEREHLLLKSKTWCVASTISKHLSWAVTNGCTTATAKAPLLSSSSRFPHQPNLQAGCKTPLHHPSGNQIRIKKKHEAEQGHLPYAGRISKELSLGKNRRGRYI